tara:strand:+ start:8366 stop:8944 length:579 start_codon:yes stop_codon:yes gene_type:complete
MIPIKYKVLPFDQIDHEGLIAKPIKGRDIEFIRKCRNSQKDILRQHHNISKKNQEIYYANHIWPQFNLDHPEIILMSLFRDNKIIGYGGLVNISWENKRAEVSYVVENQIVKNKNKYTLNFNNFLYLIKKIAFENLLLNRLFTETFDIRPLHISILEKNGFKYEGRLRSHVIINKKEIDSLLHGCLKKNHEK